MKKIIYLFILLTIGLTSCVSKKQYDDVLASEQKYYDEAQSTKKELADKKVALSELTAENESLQAQIKQLAADTLQCSKNVFSLNQEIASLKGLNAELTTKLGKSKSEEEVKLLLADLQKLQDKLQAREDDLRKAEKQLTQNKSTLDEKQKAFDEQQKKLTEQQNTLDAQNARVKELTDVLNKKDQLMKDLKNRVSQALIGFEGNGLAVTNKNGKVYVSLDEKLLFKSGKWDVDPKGITALDKLSKLLAENPDIHVEIEGHTDEVPYNGSGSILDNWDLSVKRATAIVRIILNNKDIDPIRITASGRSQFLPVDPAKTPEARQKNRRTEIILSPNLDELMNLLSK
jgi:chemotaxis protein MotB